MKLQKIALVCAFLIPFTVMVTGQNISKKKIVVIEKVTDENGEVTSKKIVKEGKEAEEYMKAKKIELGLDKEVKHIEKEVRVVVSKAEVKEDRRIKMIVRDDNGEEKIVIWNGDGEMPDEVKNHMDEADVDIDIDENSSGEVRVTVRTSDEKPRLGIVPENHVDGVEVLKVVEGSAAEEAGLMVGDIIYKVAGKTVGSDLQLSAGLDKVAEGSSTTIQFIRDGDKKSVSVKL